MKALFWSSYAILWLLVIVLAGGVLLLYRQFGLMLMPGSRRADLAGLDVGAKAPPLALDFLQNGRAPVLDWDGSESGSPRAGWVVVFANPGCSICRGLWDAASDLGTLAHKWPALEFVWIDGRPREGDPPQGWTVAVSEDQRASEAMDVPVFPFVYAIEPGGIVSAKRLVNEPEHLSLLVDEAFGPDRINGDFQGRGGGERSGSAQGMEVDAS